MGQTYSNTSKRALFVLYKFSFSKYYESFGEVHTFTSKVLKKSICLKIIDDKSLTCE